VEGVKRQAKGATGKPGDNTASPRRGRITILKPLLEGKIFPLPFKILWLV